MSALSGMDADLPVDMGSYTLVTGPDMHTGHLTNGLSAKYQKVYVFFIDVTIRHATIQNTFSLERRPTIWPIVTQRAELRLETGTVLVFIQIEFRVETITTPEKNQKFLPVVVEVDAQGLVSLMFWLYASTIENSVKLP